MRHERISVLRTPATKQGGRTNGGGGVKGVWYNGRLAGPALETTQTRWVRIRFLGHEDPRQPELESVAVLARAAGMTLDSGPSGLELRVPGERPGRGVRGEIESALDRRLESGHPIRRIISGLTKIPGPIIDATAGLGGDAAIAAASSDRNVIACERHPLVRALLSDGRERAIQAGLEPATRIEIHPGEAIDLVRSATTPPVLVMLDPMFPPRRKSSALPPKPMQRLRALLGEGQADVTSEVAALILAADAAGASRIVLKRPPDAAAPETSLGAPTFEISTKLLRWSVWERRSSSTQ